MRPYTKICIHLLYKLFNIIFIPSQSLTFPSLPKVWNKFDHFTTFLIWHYSMHTCYVVDVFDMFLYMSFNDIHSFWPRDIWQVIGYSFTLFILSLCFSCLLHSCFSFNFYFPVWIRDFIVTKKFTFTRII